MIKSPRTLGGHSDARGYGIIPTLQRRTVDANGKAGRFGRKVDGDHGRNIGNRELVAGHKRTLGEPGFEIIVEISDTLPAAFHQRRNLLILMRSGDRPVLETGNGVANRFHDRGKSLLFDTAIPLRDLRLGLGRRATLRRIRMDFLVIALDGGYFTDR